MFSWIMRTSHFFVKDFRLKYEKVIKLENCYFATHKIIDLGNSH